MAELLDVTPSGNEPTNAESWINPNGDFGEGVPESIQGLIEKKKWTNVSQLADGYSELEKFKGSGEHLVIPESVDDAEGWAKVFNAIGRPESAEGYAFDNQTGVELNDELMSGFKEFAHKAGYSQSQLEGAIQFQLESIKAGDEIYATQQAERKTENIDAMKQKWQADYEPTITKIDATAEKLGVKAYLENLGIDKEPEIVNMLLTIANSDSEDPLNPSGELAPLPTTLNDKLTTLMESDAFKERFHPDHKKVHSEFMELNMQIANLGQGKAPQ